MTLTYFSQQLIEVYGRSARIYIVDLNNTINQTFMEHYNHNRIHILFKCTWNIYQDRHILGHNTWVKFKKIPVIHSVFSDHSGINYVNNKKNPGKYLNIWTLNNFSKLMDQRRNQEGN